MSSRDQRCDLCPRKSTDGHSDFPLSHGIDIARPTKQHEHRAEAHQKKLVNAIRYILKMPTPQFEAYCQDLGFGKTIRTYHYWVEEHRPSAIDPYKKKIWGPLYFRMTIEAQQHLLPDAKQPKRHAGKDGGLHHEHAVPVIVVKRELIKLRIALNGDVPYKQVEEALMAGEIILVTKDQQKQLDAAMGKDLGGGRSGLGLRDKMPKVNGREWGLNDCHLARICQITEKIVGDRLIGPELHEREPR